MSDRQPVAGTGDIVEDILCELVERWRGQLDFQGRPLMAWINFSRESRHDLTIRMADGRHVKVSCEQVQEPTIEDNTELLGHMAVQKARSYSMN